MNDNTISYLSDDGILYYTQKLKTILDAKLAEKADETEITELEGIISALESSVNASLATKVDKVAGKGLSTNDLTDELVEAIEEAGKRATLDGVALEGDLTKAELDIATATDLTSETSARTTADATLQGNIDEINTNKIVNVTAVNSEISATEAAKLPVNGVVLIDCGANEKIAGLTFKFSGDRYLLTFFNDGYCYQNPIVAGDPVTINGSTYYMLDTSAKQTLDEISTAWEDDEIASSDDVADVASDLATLAADVYRKSQVYTKTETDSAIATAIGSITQIRYEIVQSLPATGENGVIYLVLYAEGPQGNVYQEWIWLPTTQTYETLGSTNQIDLSGYVQFTDLHALTNNEIDTIYNRVFPSNNSNAGGNSQSGGNEEPEEEPTGE